MAISRVIIRVTPFRALISLLITYLLSPLPLQVHYVDHGSNRRPQGASQPELVTLSGPRMVRLSVKLIRRDPNMQI